LTASPSLWPGPRCASVSLGASAARTCEPSIESPPCCAPSLWRFQPRDGRVPAADALCRALLEKDTRPACAAASSKDSVVDRPERLASASSPRYLLSRGFECIEDRCLQSPRTMSTTGISRTSLRFSEVALGASKVALGGCVAGWPFLFRGLLRDLLRGLSREQASRAFLDQGPWPAELFRAFAGFGTPRRDCSLRGWLPRPW